MGGDGRPPAGIGTAGVLSAASGCNHPQGAGTTIPAPLSLLLTTAVKQKIARYRKYNEERLNKAVIFNAARSNILFRAIPYLLHSNYPDLPGFVEDCPCGIHAFDPAKRMNADLFRRFFPTSTALRRDTPSPHPETPVIHSLKTIGSVGTIAQSDVSDCDFWVSVKLAELGEEGFRRLEQKCGLIEEWAAKKGVEVHFFLMDIDETRENRFAAATGQESAGSALKLLLKDELFRTHILVAGKPLLWWFIPPGLSEKSYRGFVARLFKERKVPQDHFIDLGYLADIPKSEIFGACLWQMNKALDSPFKSVIKFAYLELLLKQQANTLPLFSDKVKCLVTFPEKLPADEVPMDVGEVDPYLLLAREIVEFYRTAKDQEQHKWAALIQQCLFLKTLEGMESQKQTKFGQKSHLAATMAIMENWGLLPENHEEFLNFRAWKFKEIEGFGARVHDYLLATYNRLRWIFRKFKGEVAITERDISVLGRKLFTFYEKKEGKIEYIRSISRELMRQEDITIHITKFEGKFYYYAFQGEQDAASVREQVSSVIKREDNLIRLVAWLLINGILGPKTRLHLTKNFLPIDLVDIQLLTEAMVKTFPIIHFSEIPPEKLLEQETILRALVIVNFEKEPVRHSKTLKSTIMTENSYGEYFLKEYTTLAQLKTAMRTLLTRHFVSRWNNNLEVFIPPQDELPIIKTMLEG